MIDGSGDALLGEALKLLRAALDLLDRADAPGDIGAHVDHVLQRLRDLVDGSRDGGSRPGR